jgi:hypothetical protein
VKAEVGTHDELLTGLERFREGFDVEGLLQRFRLALDGLGRCNGLHVCRAIAGAAGVAGIARTLLDLLKSDETDDARDPGLERETERPGELELHIVSKVLPPQIGHRPLDGRADRLVGVNDAAVPPQPALERGPHRVQGASHDLHERVEPIGSAPLEQIMNSAIIVIRRHGILPACKKAGQSNWMGRSA